MRTEPEEVGGDKQAGKAANVRPRENGKLPESEDLMEEDDYGPKNPLKNLPELDEQDGNFADDEEAQPGNRRYNDEDSGY